jgi:transposase
MTAALQLLADWRQAAGCTPVAMASPRLYGRPVSNLLEGLFILLVVQAQPSNAVPRRKTAVNDAAWLAELRRHGR